jgi:hypothetical protein
VTPLPAGPLFVFDRATSFDVVLKYGALSSVGEAEVLGGANIAAIGDTARAMRSSSLPQPNSWQ